MGNEQEVPKIFIHEGDYDLRSITEARWDDTNSWNIRTEQ